MKTKSYSFAIIIAFLFLLISSTARASIPIAVAAGSSHTVMLKTDGTVWAWGDNSNGQLGNGTYKDSGTPVQATGLTNVSAIAAGRSHTVALKTDGTVWAWGSNEFGELGNETTGVFSRTPVQVTGLTNVSAIAACGIYTIALKTDGTVWAWGYNYSGQLGNGTTGALSRTPVQVTGLTNVSAISTGIYHTVALKKDGTVFFWVSSHYGQLGDGRILFSTKPVQALINQDTSGGLPP